LPEAAFVFVHPAAEPAAMLRPTKGAKGAGYGGKGAKGAAIGAGAWGGGKGKVQATVTKPWGSTYGSSKGQDSWSKGSWGKDSSWGKGGYGKGGYGKSWDSGKGWGKGKGKGKGKDYNPGAPPADDEFWVKKVAEENRQEGDGSVYAGTIQNYNFKAGWGFVQPDDVASLPDEIQTALLTAAAEAEAKGKKADSNLLYFRKPDVMEGFKPQKGTAVTFSVYTDDKGAGAHNVCPAE